MNEVTAETPEVGPIRKSIVPAKYAGKYKEGGNDALAKFITEQCKGTDGFDYAKFFELCRANGVPEDKVSHYEDQIFVEKRNAAPGRARMTLRNMLAAIVRRTKIVHGLDGQEHPMELPKPSLGGAAKTQAEQKEAA